MPPVIDGTKFALCAGQGEAGTAVDPAQTARNMGMHIQQYQQYRKGFTLIELLMVVVIIGILAAIAIPKFQNTKSKAYASSLKSDLKNLTSMQESYFYENETYSNDVSATGFEATNGVTITIAESGGYGWSASATHPSALPLTCAVYYGSAAPLSPATHEGVIECH